MDRKYVQTIMKIDETNKKFIKAQAAIMGKPMYEYLNDILEALRINGEYKANDNVQIK